MHMASRWSSEFIVAEHRDLQATAMAVDCTGTYVLLAGRRYLGLKNLIELNDTLKKFPRQSKYDVGSAEWNPHSSSKNLCAISANQKIEVLNWAQNGLTTLHSLNAHTRVVSNSNWNPFDENLLASCSIDTFTYIWDLRDPKRPAASLSNVAGVTQVRWNKQSSFLLATAHNGDVKLWDQRKSSSPVQYISAHLANIHCLDWSPNHENQLATASQDCTVKFFDTANPKMIENVKLTSAAPVWRARYTPFGNGFLMVVVPPMRRGENSLLLWNLSNRSAPVHTFVGHTDIVLEFEWRKQPDSSDYQLITWSKDQTLRIWQIEPFLQKLCGIENGSDVNIVPSSDSLLNTAPLVSSIVDVESTLVVDGRNHSIDLANGLSDTCSMSMAMPVSSSNSAQPRTLHQELSLVNVNIRNATYDMIDPEERKCTVTAAVSNNVVVVHISFPLDYPHNVTPVFQFGSSTTVDSTLKNKLLKVLKQTAQQRVKRNRPCLEHCVRQLVSSLEEASHADEVDQSQYLQMQGALLQHSSLYNLRDEFVPFPRTSGAKFCNVGMLVCFGRVLGRNNGARPDIPTPRSLSALKAYTQEAPPPVPAFFYQNRLGHKPRLGRNLSRLSQKGSKSCVIVYDASALFPMKKELAMKYIFNPDDVPSMCLYNAQVAGLIGRKDLAQIWSLAALAATSSVNDEDDLFPWGTHPLSVGLIQSMVDHYISEHDVQTAAMLCCAFGNKIQNQSAPCIFRALSSSPEVTKESPYHTMHRVDSSVESLNIIHKRNPSSHSWSECSLDDFTAMPAVEMSDVTEPEPCESRVVLPDCPAYEHCKLTYADILHRWHLLEARSQVMKFVSRNTETHQGIEPTVECLNCRQKGKDVTCVNCRIPVLMCVICHTSVKGGANACFICGHGGHTQHIYQWFTTNSVCPTGCGCQCLIESISSLDL